jgi:hypothetical protein
MFNFHNFKGLVYELPTSLKIVSLTILVPTYSLNVKYLSSFSSSESYGSLSTLL